MKQNYEQWEEKIRPARRKKVQMKVHGKKVFELQRIIKKRCAPKRKTKD